MAFRLAIVAVAGAVFAASMTPAAAERVLERLPGTDIPGFDYRTLRNVPLADCERVCLADTDCAAFTYNERAQWCFLKSEVGPRTPYRGATSAVVRESAPDSTLPMPDISYLPAAFAQEAQALSARVSAINRTGVARDGLAVAAASILSRGTSQDWLNFARTTLDQRARRFGERILLERTAGAAAYLALENASTVAEQGEALAVISDVLERQSLFRPAIFASEASVALRFDTQESERLERLRSQFGFRVLDYTVNAELDAPRMCVQFSEPLSGDAASLQRFVTLDGASDPAISVESRQLCVEGLAHGERFEVGLREGLPSTVGERLSQPASFRVYVRDRAPSARFDANDYVLPSNAPGVPVATMNTARLELSLMRVGDRNLAETVRRGDFKRQLWPWEVSSLAAERGATVWSGHMAVETRRNATVRTLVPVSDMVGEQEPGVYVLTARPVELANQNEALATQWFVVSNLGLSAYSSGGTVEVFARALQSAEPLEGVALTLLAANDEVLAEGITNQAGHVRLVSRAPAEGNRAPALVTAGFGADDYAFLALSGAAFELTDRGVEGRTAPGPVDAFIATERGVYRAGETVNATVLVRDDKADALNLPVTLKVTRPDGVLSRSLVARARDAGGAAVTLPLTTNAATGTWRISAHADPDAPAVGETSFLVEDFVPQRIAVKAEADVQRVAAGDSVPVTVQADFLYGAPASNLMMEGAVVVRQTRTMSQFEGFEFGLAGEAITPVRTPLQGLPRTDEDGSATFDAPVNEPQDVTGPLEARISVSVREPGGRQVGDAITVPVLTGTSHLGIKPLFEGGRVAEGSTAAFEVIGLRADLQRIAMDAEWSLTRIERNFQWYRRNGRWFYDAVERFDKVAEGRIALDAAAPIRLEEPVRWGQYRLEVSTADGSAATSLIFDAGWVNTAADAQTPDVLEVHLDKESYTAGDVATFRIVPRREGKALVTVLGAGVEESRFVPVPAEGTSIEIAVEDDWAPGVYVAATLFTSATAGGPPLPERSVGIAHMAVGTAEKRLSVEIDAPEIAAPRGITRVPVQVSGLAPGEQAHLTVAAVDVGILNLTGYTPPDVDAHYLGQRRLGVEMRDLYGDLIDSAGAPLGRVRTGGDGVAGGTEALPPTEDPVSLFTGVIETDENGLAEAVFDIPAFNGTLRVMAIVWTETKVGDASADMTVRDPVVVSGTLPRFLAPGDATRMRFDLHNVAHAAGEYRLTLDASGPISLDSTSQTIRLDTNGRGALEMPIAATDVETADTGAALTFTRWPSALANGAGTAQIVATLTGPDGLEQRQNFRIAVRPAANPVAERRQFAIVAGETLRLPDPGQDGFGEDAVVSVTVGGGDVDSAGLLAMLDRFPYGCAEQTVSRALPLLYANDVAERIGLVADGDVPERINAAIDRLLSYQGSTGGFGLWAPGNDLWLTAYVMDFLSRAREAGYEVSDTAFEQGLNRLQSVLSFIGNIEGERSGEIAYATYVLARNGRAAIGDLRYFAQDQLEKFPTALARAQLAASLSFTGDQSLADGLFARALEAPSQRPGRLDYGTPLRDAAAIVTLAAESRAPQRTLAQLTRRVTAAATDAGERAYSTQEAAWLVLSANAAADTTGVAMVNGEEVGAPGTRAFDAAAMASGVSVQNVGQETLAIAATVTGTPLAPLPRVSNGLTITRSFHGLDGEEIDPSRVAQNTRIVVRLTVRKTRNAAMRIMLTDLLPAGFEVENPRLLSSADAAGVPMVQDGAEPEYREFRDDRFAAAWTLDQASDRPMTVSYMVRAISPGTFTLPAAEVVDMYQPAHVARTEAGTLSVVPTR